MTSKLIGSCLALHFILISCLPTQAQLLNRLKNRTVDKIEQRLEDKLVEELSNEIARRVMRPVDKAFDDFIRESYRKEYGEDYSDEDIDSLMNNMGSNYAQFLEGLNKAADLPPSYTFNYQMIMEAKEESGEKSEVEMWFSANEAVAGFKSAENPNTFVVIDMTNDIVVLYTEENGKKTAQAIPAMLKITGAIIASDESTQAWMDADIEGPGKSKKIVGYQANQYKVENEEFKNEYYITNDIPFSWHDSFYQSLSQYAPGIYNENAQKMKGVMLEGTMYDKKEKEKSSFKTKKISENAVTLNHSDYQIKGLTE